jgi:hypothetical protein
MATGQNLIQNEIKKALGMPLDNITAPEYKGVWCNYILHSNKQGTLASLEFDQEFQSKYIRDVGLIVKNGDQIVPFTGANSSLGTLFLRFDTREELDSTLNRISDYIHINLR